MLVLFIPWILLVLVVGDILCLLKRWNLASGLLLVVVLILNWYWQVFSFGINPLSDKKEDNVFRVVTWNISYADSTGTDNVEGLLSVIQNQDADVVFLTEYLVKESPEVDSLLSVCYPFKGNIENWTSYSNFYSRMPIDTCIHVCDGEHGSLLRYDVSYFDQLISMYCLHLQSNNMVNGDIFYPDSIEDRGGFWRYLENYETAAEIRGLQASQIIDDFDDVPTIVMGDMNDVMGSPCMQVFADAGLRDAWWEGGFGYGATIHSPLPYRIDHVMYGKGLKLKGIKKVSSKGLSDHDALVADFEIK